MKGILLVSHGSYSALPKTEAELLAEKLKQKTGVQIFEVGFLEIEYPDISKGIEICIEKGATEVLVLLNFLNSGRHVNKDIPSIVKEVQDKFPHIKITISQPVGQHAGMVDLFTDMILHG